MHTHFTPLIQSSSFQPIGHTPPLILRAPHHLHHPRPYPSLHHPFPPNPQPPTHLHKTPVPPIGILVSTPQHLGRGGRAGPHDGIEVDGVGFLGPDVDFTAEDEVEGGCGDVGWGRGVGGGDGGEGGMGVDEVPVFDGGAVVEVGVVRVGG